MPYLRTLGSWEASAGVELGKWDSIVIGEKKDQAARDLQQIVQEAVVDAFQAEWQWKRFKRRRIKM